MNTDALIRNARRTVLIVEDEAINRELLGFILSRQYEVLFAENGREALNILRGHVGRISMLLLDINMPVMNGIEVLRIMREDPALSQIPVIVLTAEKSSELETLQLGAMDFITKPYDMPEIILARVQRIIEFIEDREIIRDVEQDGLTDLYTRNFFHEYCRRMLADGHQRDMLAIDIAHFRLVNEVNGKAFGDIVLRAVADGIREALEGGLGIGCRNNGDLFYVFIEHTDDYAAICETISRRVHQIDQAGSVRLRMGVYRNVDTARVIEWYSDAAKAACNSIRSNYVRNVQVYDEAMHEKELFNERLISDIDEAIAQKQFRVFFQPKYDIRGEEPRLYSAEALVRWQHPELGFISPGAFIPLFEESGLITRLDEYVWRETAACIRRWRDVYGVDFPVSVNLSRMDFFRADLRELLLGIVAEHDISVKNFMLEVTESAYSEDMSRILDIVRDLRDAGFQIEMDDFGSGYSSLNMLCLMPIDALKIDMKFAQNIANTCSGYRMVELVIEMARSLSVPAVVEGVEDETQYRLMKRVGCDIVQGYYFSRPVDAQTFEKLFQ